MGVFNRVLGKNPNDAEDSSALPSSSPSPLSSPSQNSDDSDVRIAGKGGQGKGSNDNGTAIATNTTRTATNSKNDDNNLDPVPPELVADRIRRIIGHVDPYLSPDDTWPLTLTDCPSMTSLCSSCSDSGSSGGSSSSRSPKPQILLANDRNEHWPLTEIRQLPKIAFPCVQNGMTACELGIFMVKTMYRRDRFLGGVVTLLVDAGGTYGLIGRSVIKYLGVVNDKGNFLSDSLVSGDAHMRPMRTGNQNRDHAGYCQPTRRRSCRPVPPVATAGPQSAHHNLNECLEPQAAPTPVQGVEHGQQNQIQIQNQDFIGCHYPRPKRGGHASQTHALSPRQTKQNRRLEGCGGDAVPQHAPAAAPRIPIPQPRWPFLGDEDDPREHRDTNNDSSANHRYSLGSPLDLNIFSPVHGSVRFCPSSPVGSFSSFAGQQQQQQSQYQYPHQDQQQQRQESEPVAPIHRAGYNAEERHRKHRGIFQGRTLPSYPRTVFGSGRSGGGGSDPGDSLSTQKRKSKKFHSLLERHPWGFLDEHRRRLDENGE